MRHRLTLVAIAIVTAVACLSHATFAAEQTAASQPTTAAAAAAAAREASKNWLRQAKYGVCGVFLGGGADWNDTVDAFDVEAFAAQMEQAGAGYVMLTLGQNSGYYCAPNAAYDRFGGFKPGERCSRRDLPMDLAERLGKRNIKLLLYFTARAPQNEKQARAGLAEIDDILNQPATQEFSRRWWEVIREWSERYGERVVGWWFDGAYATGGWNDFSKPQNWHTWAAAARAGHPGRLLAFNKGTHLEDAFGRLTDEQDYTAGERNGFDVTQRETPPPPPGVVWHLLGYMGKDWGQPGGPTRGDDWMIDYIRRINDAGGVVTMDVHVKDGRVHPPHLDQLIAIRRAVRGGAAK